VEVEEMLKKIGLPVVALGGMLAFAAPKQAGAQVRFGVSVGAPVYGPAYAAPAPVSPYNYPGYNSYDPYYAPPYPTYVAPAPVYVGPSIGFGFGYGGHSYRRPVIVNRGYSYGHGGGYRGFSGGHYGSHGRR